MPMPSVSGVVAAKAACNDESHTVRPASPWGAPPVASDRTAGTRIALCVCGTSLERPGNHQLSLRCTIRAPHYAQLDQLILA